MDKAAGRLHVVRSNRVEVLMERLAAGWQERLPDPLQPEMIVVQSLGMRRWVSLELARRFGVAMNCDFPFIAEFGERVFRSAFPEEKAGAGFRREVLPWRVLAAMEGAWENPRLEPLRRYVGNDPASELKRFELARQIATVFDRYLAHRPEWLWRWEQTQEGDWQGELWRALAQAKGAMPPSTLLRRLQETGAEPVDLPPRLAVFGVASLAPFYLHLIKTVASHREVHCFLFEPTDQYWGDQASPREQRKFLRRHAKPGQTAADFHLEGGNELLTSWGKAGQAFAREVLELEPARSEEEFRPPEGRTLLEVVQRAIFELAPAKEVEGAGAHFGDGSLQIHCCHTALREVEVLYDQLLDLFQKDPALTPKDILVTMPDVQTHAPFIEAVFGAPESEHWRIPYTIADRAAATRSTVARSFLALLALPGGRMTVTEVVELLETEAVRERFGITEPDLETLRAGLARNGVRWGVDARHRAKLGLPAFAENSWRAGLDRWLLGAALPAGEDRLYGNLLPDAEAEGEQAILAGRLADFAEELFAFCAGLEASRPLQEWSRTLRRALETFFIEETEAGNEVHAVRKALMQLDDFAEWHQEPISFTALRAHLQAALGGETDGGGGFLAGRVTFCSLKPMRSIPFKVVCVLGMNDGAFPRRDLPLTYDLLAAGQEVRSRREEDRQLFLESLLSARDVFYLSYCGLSPTDQSEAPPATMVSELLEHLEAMAPDEGNEGDSGTAHFVTRHPLQPFAAAYFRGEGGLFSYSPENLAMARARGKKRVEPGFWLDRPLPAIEPEWRQVELEQLLRFFSNPARFFLQKRLRLELPEEAAVIDDCEPLALVPLESWKLADRLALGTLGGRGAEAGLAELARGTLPAGYFGSASLEEAQAGVARMRAKLAGLGLGTPHAPHPFRIELGEWVLSGTLAELYAEGQVLMSGSSLSEKPRLKGWLKHLVLRALSPTLPVQPRTALLGADVAYYHHGPDDARERLQEMLELYGQGLLSPLPFWPAASYDFARRHLDPKPRKNAGDPATEAAKLFAKQRNHDAHLAFCFPAEQDIFDARGQAVALLLCGALVEDLSNQWTLG